MNDQMAIKLAICLALFTGLLMVVIKLLEWRRRPETRPCKWFGHDRKYVAIRLSACVPATSPEASGRGFPCDHNHQIGDKDITIARWVCRRCPEMKEECFGRGKDWKIEHERVVPDVKKWANWSVEPPNPAREKLKEIQKRIEDKEKYLCGACNTEHERDPEKCPKVIKALLDGDKASTLRYCDRCKAEHTGSCPAL